jgi:hypothetical protein
MKRITSGKRRMWTEKWRRQARQQPDRGGDPVVMALPERFNRMALAAMVCGLLVTALSGCGGGDGSDADVDNDFPTFRECSTLTPGVRYRTSDGLITEIVSEPFRGQQATGVVRRNAATGLREDVEYSVLDGNVVRSLGGIEYDERGNPEVIEEESTGLRTDIFPGQTVVTTGSVVQINRFEDGTSRVVNLAERVAVTFVAHETLVLNGLTFPNACKVDIETSNGENERVRAWLFPGYGVIRYDDFGDAFDDEPEERVFLTEVLAGY